MKGPKVSPVINLLNVIYEDVADGLKTYGWDVRLVEQYSQDTYHKILTQEPAPGVQLAAGEPLTLTVSGGTTVTLGVNLADLISLDAANLPLDQVRPGENSTSPCCGGRSAASQRRTRFSCTWSTPMAGS